ncbi:hypothetical protein [Clostridium sp. 1001283B150210_160208_E6]|uniref:hypothetical protein n=1 Tax=Clostridium sp. 1001283B150210_160208_E6 TaxID=2787129 RepID=UPI0018A96EA2|nr:hypothetical protein [Clostridium sp. 1001283B150210_160208_E6]
MRSVKANGKAMRIELYRNRSEFLYNIPLEWIDKIEYRYNDISKFEIKVPKYIGVDHKINPIYMKILSRQQIVIDDNDRYILMEKKGLTKKHNGDKTFTAYRFQKTLEKKRISIESGNYQLISDETHIAKGILELALEGTQWTIGEVDNDARIVNQLAPVIETIGLYEGYTKNNVQYEDLLWSKDFNITIPEDKPLYITVNYNGVEANKEGTKYGFANVINKFDPFYTGIKHIDAYYVNEVNNRFGVKYVVTLQDGVQETVSHTFVNTTDKNLSIENINLQYETGEYIEQDIIAYPSFDEIDDNVLNLLEKIEEVFECVMDYDTITKTINCYAKKNVGVSKQPMLSFNSNILEISDTEDSEIPTGIKVIGKDGLSISGENIFGGDIIYNYNYYINNKILSDECITNWNRFVALATIKRDEWDLIKSQVGLMGSKKIKLDSEITSLSNRITYNKELLSTYIATGDKEAQKEIQLEIEELETKFNACMRDLDDTNKQIQELNDRTSEISNSLNRKTAKDDNGLIFTEDDLQELDDIDEIITLEDDYYTNANLLYEYAKKELEDKTNPKIDWEMDSINFTKCSKNWKKVITLGDLFLCKSDVEEVIKQEEVRLVGFDYIPKNDVIDKVYFSNKDSLTNKLQKGFGTSARKASKSYQKVNSYEQIWQDSIMSNNLAKTLLENGLNLATMQVNGRSVKNILDMGSYGVYVSDTESETGSYLGSNLFAITKDGWKTSEIAISSEGINAKLLISTIILSEKLTISSEDTLFYIGITDKAKEGFGLRISEGNAIVNTERLFLGLEKDSDGIRRAKLRLISKDGQEVILSDEGILNHNEFNVFDNISPEDGCEMTIPIKIPSGTRRMKECILTLFPEKYRLWSRGASSGGGVNKTSESGGSINKGASSSYVDEHRHIMFKSAENAEPIVDIDQAVEYLCSASMWGADGSNVINSLYIPVQNGVISPKTLYTYGQSNRHNHTFTIVIDGHTHVIKIDPHTHDDVVGVRTVNNTPSNIKVVVNGTTVATGINGYGVEVDITDYIDINNPNNIVKIYSSTHGRLTVNVFEKRFINF